VDIHLWYGKAQRFGHWGVPQRWINILGTVSEAQEPVSVHYQLNGGPERPLSVGPDGLRLRGEGDFNAEIACPDLQPGANEVVLTAVDRTGQRVTQRVTVAFTPDRRWPLPYRVRWNEVTRIPDVVHVVEGQWQHTLQGIRPRYPAYDRLVAIGDQTWTDYQVQAKLTVHGFVEAQDGHPNGGFGLLMRWTGHYADEHQPSREWRPSGAIGWYRARWEDTPAHVRCLNISDGVIVDTLMVETPPRMLDIGVPHVFQCGVRSRPGTTSLYTLRVWPDGQPDALLCDLSTPGREGESPQGSVLFIALYADVTIGDIEVTAL
jgi:hypothetical protein